MEQRYRKVIGLPDGEHSNDISSVQRLISHSLRLMERVSQEQQ